MTKRTGSAVITGSHLTRRDFLRLGGVTAGAIGLQPLLSSCKAEPAATQTSGATEAVGPIEYWGVAWTGADDYVKHYYEPYQTLGGHPEFSLHNVSLAADRMPERITLALLAGGGPVVADQATMEWPKYTWTGMADPIPLDIFEVGSYDELAKFWKPGVFDLMKAASRPGDNKVYPIDQHNNIYAHVYNATIFDEAGIPRPSPTEPMDWTEWSEITSALSIWKGDTLERAGYSVRVDTPNWKEVFGQHFHMLVRQNGGKVLSDDGTKALFDSPEALEGLQVLVDFFKKYKTTVPGFVTDPYGDFEAGRIVSLLMYPAFYGGMRAKFEKGELPFEPAAAPFPVIKGGKRIYIADDGAWIVFSNAPEAQRKAAWQWIAWTVKHPNEVWKWHIDTWGASVAFPNKYHDEALAKDPYKAPFWTTSQFAENPIMHPRALEIKDVVTAAIQSTILEDVPLATSMKAAREQVDGILAEPGL